MIRAWHKFKYTILLSLFFAPIYTSAWAHNPGQSLVVMNLADEVLHGEIHIYYDDLKSFIPNLPSQTSDINLDTVQPHIASIQEFFIQNITIHLPDDPKPLQLQISTSLHTDNTRQNLIAKFQAKLRSVPRGSLKISTNGFFKNNSQFSTLVVLKTDRFQRTAILTAKTGTSKLFTNNYSEFLGFLRYGMNHIYAGLDHLFFLMLLIFSPFLHASERNEKKRFLKICWNVIKLSTAFTVSHSLTLSLAVLKISYLPQAFVETFILVSIIFVGITNLSYRERSHEWLMVFMFGLFHGYGFSTALNEVGLSRENLIVPLVGFNLGVEIGQIAVLLSILLPLYFLYVRWEGTPRLVRFCCGGITLIATGWLIARIIHFF
jgi:hydrogenase/urease accessory protein HupE